MRFGEVAGQEMQEMTLDIEGLEDRPTYLWVDEEEADKSQTEGHFQYE